MSVKQLNRPMITIIGRFLCCVETTTSYAGGKNALASSIERSEMTINN